LQHDAQCDEAESIRNACNPHRAAGYYKLKPHFSNEGQNCTTEAAPTQDDIVLDAVIDDWQDESKNQREACSVSWWMGKIKKIAS
jgi:hypothetical protein